jgi:hypothetical protein
MCARRPSSGTGFAAAIAAVISLGVAATAQMKWTQASLPLNPQPRGEFGMAYDAARQRVVLFGGFAWSLSDTWEWDGNDWTQRSPSASPPARHEHGMAHDAVKGATVLFGGMDAAQTPMNDTWEYAPTDLIASSHRASVATGGSIRFSLDAGTALAGKVYWLLGCVDNAGPRGIGAGNVTLLLNPDPYFWFTAAYPNPLIAGSLGQLDSAGKAAATLLVPKGLPPTLVGTRFFHAYVAFHSRIHYASTPVPLTLVP